MARKQWLSVGELTLEGAVNSDAVTVLAEDTSLHALLCKGASLPTGTAGYAVGCEFINTSTGQHSINTGSVTSCSFVSDTLDPYSGLLTLSGNTALELTGTAVTKGINFAGAGVAMTDADNCLLSYGTWNDEVDVGTHTAHFVPFQVHIHSTSASAYDIAAMRLRVDTDGDNTGAALQVLQIRSSVSDDTASIGTMGAGLSIDAACNVDTGEVVCGGFSIAGGYKPTCGNKVTVLQACNWNTFAGTSINYIFDAYQNGTGNTVDACIHANVIAGTATSGVSVVNTSGTMVNGVLITNATLGVTTGRAIKVSTSQAAPAMEDGYGVVEIDHTITGTAGGTNHASSALSSWINIPTGAVVGAGKYVCAQNNGIYEDSGATITNAKVIYGMRAQKLLGDTDAKSFAFSLNMNSVAHTAIFEAPTATDMGMVAGVAATGGFKIPFLSADGGTIYYMNLYTS